MGPNEAVYRDTGCNLAPKCLECPFPRCQYDRRPLPGNQRQMIRSESRYSAIRAHYETHGMDANVTAEALGVSARTVFRALEKVKR